MLEPTAVVVNEREYTVTPFDPVSAFEFFHRYTAARAARADTTGLGRKALAQCMTPGPEYRALDKPDTFMEWFSKHPEDLFPLEAAAVEALSSPFYPSRKNTGENETN